MLNNMQMSPYHFELERRICNWAIEVRRFRTQLALRIHAVMLQSLRRHEEVWHLHFCVIYCMRG